MARKAMIEKANKTPKFSTRARNRCRECGRPRGFMRDFLNQQLVNNYDDLVY